MTKISYLAVSAAIMALQGCSAAPMTEDTAVSQEAVTTCDTMGGVFPTKAALAVAMGIEYQRFEPSKDLAFNGYSSNVTANTGNCKVNNCRNTKAILAQQSVDYSQMGGSQIFDTTTYKTELINGFAAQTTLNNLLPSKGKPQPPDHKAILKSGPVDLGTQACGKQYVFDIFKPDGVTQLTAAEKSAMIYWFCFFGQAQASDIGYSCGNNPYVGFMLTATDCPVGHFCIALDPDPGDQGTSSTTSGAALTYPMNRVYAPDDPNFHLNKSELINKPCTKTTGVAGRLQAKTGIADYLYCMQ